MKLIKMLGLTASLALAAMALAGVSSASAAAVHVESCEGLTPCKTSSVGTVLQAKGEKVTLSNSFLTNTCESEVEVEVVDPTAEGANEIEANVNGINFTPCSPFTVDVNEATLPWLLSTSESLFNASKTGLVSGGVLVSLLGTPVGTCNYAETSTDMVGMKYIDGNPAVIELTGSLEREANSNALCGLGKISGKYTVTNVSDPGFAGATNARIL